MHRGSDELSEGLNADAGNEVNTFLDRIRFRPEPEFSVTPENDWGLEVVANLSHQLIDDLALFLSLCWQFSDLVQELPSEKHAVLASMNPREMSFPPEIAAEIDRFASSPEFNSYFLSEVYLMTTESHRDLTRAVEMLPVEIRNADGLVVVNGITGRSYLEALERFGFHVLKTVLSTIHATAAKEEVTGWDRRSLYWIPLSSFGPVCLAIAETWPEIEAWDTVHQLLAVETELSAEYLIDWLQQQQTAGATETPVQAAESIGKVDEERDARLKLLRTILWQRHFDAEGHSVGGSVPLGPTEIHCMIKRSRMNPKGWSPAGITRMFQAIFAKGGFKAYQRLCDSPDGQKRLRQMLDADRFREKFLPLFGDVPFHESSTDETYEMES